MLAPTPYSQPGNLIVNLLTVFSEMNVTNILRENGQDTLDVTSEESVTDTRPCDTSHEVTCLRAYHETSVITDSAPVGCCRPYTTQRSKALG